MHAAHDDRYRPARAGVDPAILRAVVARDFAAMPYDVALAVRSWSRDYRDRLDSGEPMMFGTTRSKFPPTERSSSK